jgi:hypothetical protein
MIGFSISFQYKYCRAEFFGPGKTVGFGFRLESGGKSGRAFGGIFASCTVSLVKLNTAFEKGANTCPI